MTQTLRFDDRVAIVTGAGRGIGREYALLLADRGAAVVVNDLGSAMTGEDAADAPADRVVTEITEAGGTAVASYDSVATPEGAAAIVATALERWGRVDALINNAGILRMVAFPDLNPEFLQRHLDVHVHGTVNMCQAVWDPMATAGYGRILNTVSGSIFGLPDNAEYGTAKGGVFVLTRGLALEGAPVGINVNAIAPQAATRMLDAAALDPDVKEGLRRQLPPSLVAPAAVFLAHEACELQGETLAVSGGKVCRIGLTENEGFTDRDLTPEMVLSRMDEVLDTSTARHWTSSVEKYSRRAAEA